MGRPASSSKKARIPEFFLTDPLTLRNATYSGDRRPLSLSDNRPFANIAALIEKHGVDRLARHVLLECDKFSTD